MVGRLRTAAAALLATIGWLTSASAADPDLSHYYPRCDGKFGLCRYVDRETWLQLIPPRFEVATPFSEGLAAVLVSGGFGYIDARGEIVIPPRFEFAGPFRLGLAEVRVDGKAGVIDRVGQMILSPRFWRAVPLTKDVIVASEHPPDHWENPDLFGRLPVTNAGLYHVNGQWIRRPGPDVKSFSTFEREGRGLVWATVRGEKSDLVGLMASDGSWVVEPQFSWTGELFDDRAIVRKPVDGVMHSGAVDASGELVVPMKPWVLTTSWRNGQAIATERQGLGMQKVTLVDKSGNMIGGRWFDKVERAEAGSDIGIVWPDGVEGRAVGLDRAGNLVANPRNGRVTASCSSGLRAVYIDGKTQITDANGQPTSPHLFGMISGRLDCSQPIAVRLGAKQGFAATDGRLLFDPPRFDNQYFFNNGTAVVSQNGKWGVIDMSGRFVVEARFDGYGGSRDGLFRMKLNGSDVWFDASGNERPEPPPVSDAERARELYCGHGVRMFSRDGLWGIVDGDKEIIEPKYRAVVCFRNGVTWVPIDDRRQWCALGPDGAEYVRRICVTAHYPHLVKHSAAAKFHDDPFESSVLWTRAYLEHVAGRREEPPGWADQLR
jgi:hypothetical protein